MCMKGILVSNLIFLCEFIALHHDNSCKGLENMVFNLDASGLH